MAPLYILTVVLLGLVVVLAFVNRLDAFRERYSEGVNFVFSLIATLIGVFIAMGLAQGIQNTEKKQKVCKLLDVAIGDLTISDFSAAAVGLALDSDTLEKASDAMSNGDFLANAIPFPQTTKAIISSELIIETVSPQSYGFMMLSMRELEAYHFRMSIPEISKPKAREILKVFQAAIGGLRYGIVVEKLFLQGEIDEDLIDPAWKCFQQDSSNQCEVEDALLLKIRKESGSGFEKLF